MSEINIIYNWKNKEVKTTLTKDEEKLLIDAVHSKAMKLEGANYRLLEEKIVFGLLGDRYRHVTNLEDIEEVKEILEMGISLNYNFQVDMSLD